MKMFLKRTGRLAARGIVTLCALFILALISIQIILVVGINAMNTGRGTGFIQEKINGALKDSGYRLAFDGLYYDPVQGLSVRGLSVFDTQGSFLHIERFSAKASFARAPLHTLDVSAHGNVMTLSRLPVSQEKPENAEKATPRPFSTPDIYFRKIILSNLSFEKLVLEEPVLGKPYILSPSLRGDVDLTKNILFSVELKPGMDLLAENLEAPDTVAFSGTFAPEALDLSEAALSIKAASYNISANGKVNLGADGHIDLSAETEHRDLGALTQNAFQEMTATLSANGPLSAPAVELDAGLVTRNLKERGLSDIFVSLKTGNIKAGLKGFAKIETSFQENPVMLEATLSYDAPKLSITEIKGSAPGIFVAGDIVFFPADILMDGSLTVTATDISRYKDLAGINIAGKMEVKSIFSKSADGEQGMNLDLAAGDIVLDSYKIKKLNAQAALASLTHPWPQSARLSAAGLQLAPNITLDTLSASVSESGNNQYQLLLNGGGDIPTPISFDGSADISQLTQPIPVFKNIALKIRQGASTANVKGNFSRDQMNIALNAGGYRAQDLPLSLPDRLTAMRIDMDTTITGDPARPQTSITAKLRGIGTGPYKDSVIDIKTAHDGTAVKADITGKGKGIRTLSVSASAPMTWGIVPFHFALDKSAPLQGAIRADLDLASISPLFLPPIQSLSGTLAADGTLQGTISTPDPKASLRLSDARFEDSESGITIEQLNASATVTRDSLTLESLSATDGQKGIVKGNGTLSFDGGAANLSFQARNFNAPRSELANGFLNADISLKGDGQKLDLFGKADILEMNIMIPEKFSSNIPQLNIVEDAKDETPGLFDLLTLDIAIDAKNQIFVRGWGLDAEFGGRIDVTGTALEPKFNGAFASRRGRFEEFGKRFKLERANLQFQGSIPPSPYLDVEATTPAGDVTGSILLTGPAQSPSIKFTSTPSLPEDEVLSRILFGKDSTKISPFQAVQLAQTIRRFSGDGGGGFDPLGTLRSVTGLDDISVETDESGGTSVDAGKYLSDNVYLEFSKGKAENSGAATIQIELTPSVNIESEIGQDAQGGGGVFWKHDY